MKTLKFENDEDNAMELKEYGNQALKSGEISTAVYYYTRAIQSQPSHVNFSNRSAAYQKQRRFRNALNDANEAIKIKSNWWMGYYRKAMSLLGLQCYDDALEAVDTGLKYAPGNKQLQALRQEIIQQAEKAKKVETTNHRLPIEEAVIQNQLDQTKKLLLAGFKLSTKIRPNGETLLHVACRNSETSPEMLQFLLNSGASVDDKTFNGYTPIHFCAAFGTEKQMNVFINWVKKYKKYPLEILDNSHNELKASPLMMACFQDNVNIVGLLIKNGIDYKTITPQGKTALHVCAERGSYNCATLLISLGADVNKRDNSGNTALHSAASGTHLIPKSVTKGGLRIACDDTNTVGCPHSAIVDLLLEKGAAKNAQSDSGLTPLETAVSHGHYPVVKKLLERGAVISKNALASAASKGYPGVVKLLLDYGADPNYKAPAGYPLLLAIAAGFPETTLVLLEGGADPNITQVTDSITTTPLAIACLQGMTTIVQELVDYGAEINAPRNHAGPLHFACRRDHIGPVKVLLANNVKVTAVDHKGNNVFHYIAANGNKSMLQLIVNHLKTKWANFPEKIVLVMIEKSGQHAMSPLEIAQANGHTHLVDWFKKEVKQMGMKIKETENGFEYEITHRKKTKQKTEKKQTRNLQSPRGLSSAMWNITDSSVDPILDKTDAEFKEWLKTYHKSDEILPRNFLSLNDTALKKELERLLSLLQSNLKDKALLWVINLAMSKRCHYKLMELNVLKYVTPLLSDSNIDIQISAITAISNLALHSLMKAKMISKGIINKLVAMALKKPPPNHAEKYLRRSTAALQALHNILRERFRETILKCKKFSLEALQATLTTALTSKKEESVSLACCVLSNFIPDFHASTKHLPPEQWKWDKKFIKDGCLKPIVDLARDSNSEDTAICALLNLNLLAANNWKAVVDLGVIDICTQRLTNSHDNKVISASLSLLATISHNADEEIRGKILKISGMIPRLIAFLDSTIVDKAEAARLLFNTLSHPQLRSLINQQDTNEIINRLATIITSTAIDKTSITNDEAHALRYSAGALVYLFEGQNMDSLLQKDIIVHLIRTSIISPPKTQAQLLFLFNNLLTHGSPKIVQEQLLKAQKDLSKLSDTLHQLQDNEWAGNNAKTLLQTLKQLPLPEATKIHLKRSTNSLDTQKSSNGQQKIPPPPPFHKCEVCGDPGLKRCSRCKSVYYCSRECQLKHWTAGHKLNCKA